MANQADYSNEFYEALSADLCQELRKQEKKLNVPAGTKLIATGVSTAHVTIVNAGSVEISVPAGDKSISLAVAGKGKVLGLRSIVGGVASEIDVTTLEDCAIALIPAPAFLAMVKRYPEMYLAISKVLSADLKLAELFLRQKSGGSGRSRRTAEATH